MPNVTQCFSYTALTFFYFHNGKVFHDVLNYSHVNKVTDLDETLTTTE